MLEKWPAILTSSMAGPLSCQRGFFTYSSHYEDLFFYSNNQQGYITRNSFLILTYLVIAFTCIFYDLVSIPSWHQNDTGTVNEKPFFFLRNGDNSIFYSLTFELNILYLYNVKLKSCITLADIYCYL